MADSAISPPIQPSPQTKRGLVKQVLSGDAIVLQGPPSSNGPPPEVTVYLSGVSAPRLGKRPTESQPGSQDEAALRNCYP
ncbi:hypothetical protein WR25_14927 [Diploscapter pachys]|uniref:Uncharacterized protein n=1 Tax=Diploscapter pachys TaxID=2018661 RepID=A0A2A2JYE9_9BILA|nr:hypothetical protein WR25_14927 [Diploscapter pachys]